MKDYNIRAQEYYQVIERNVDDSTLMKVQLYKQMGTPFEEMIALLKQELDLNFDGSAREVEEYSKTHQKASESGSNFLTRFLRVWFEMVKEGHKPDPTTDRLNHDKVQSMEFFCALNYEYIRTGANTRPLITTKSLSYS